MQFKHPELLYALFLLLIPIIVHLFQLRKFQKVAFTNVAFLKEATLQTRKSSQIKKWLILCTRLLLLAAIILAFAQPFTSKLNTFKAEKETVIYLDNSFSMQAKGPQGELLKRAVQDIISNVPEDETISLIFNNNTIKNTSIKAIKNELLQLKYAPNKLPFESVLLKSKSLFSKQENTTRNLVIVSDFQDEDTNFKLKTDSLTQLHLVKLQPTNTNNVSIDSAFISETTASAITLKVLLKNSGTDVENLPVSLYNNNSLIAKTSVTIKNSTETMFSLPLNTILNGKISIDDAHLQFDNTLFFNVNNASKINVLSINATDDDFLKRIYTNDEFNYTSTPEKELNYNNINQQRLIILNELNVISSALVAALKSFSDQGGTVIIIPSEKSNILSYNELLNYFGSNFNAAVSVEKLVTKINYAHPLYNNGVFEKQVTNFQYPKTSQFYNITSNNTLILQFEDGKPFLCENKNVFVFTSALNEGVSNFKNSPLIVPTLYNIGKFSFKIPELYYTIGKENSFDVETQLEQDGILTLDSGTVNLIPKQQYFNSKVVINTDEEPSIAATYSIKNKNESLKNVSFNYDRKESNLSHTNFKSSENVTVSNSITEIFDIIKSDTKVNALWKWFVIFALLFLLIEMCILKYFK